MVKGKFHIIDDSGIKWWMPENNTVYAQPYCVEHHLPMSSAGAATYTLYCPDCDTMRTFPRYSSRQKEYAANKIRSKDIAKLDIIDHNGVLTPVAKIKTKNDEYSVTTQIMESKHGNQIVIYAGKKGGKKTQIFVDPEKHKLSHDHKDTHPTEIFAKIEATFKDGTKMAIEAKPET